MRYVRLTLIAAVMTAATLLSTVATTRVAEAQFNPAMGRSCDPRPGHPRWCGYRSHGPVGRAILRHHWRHPMIGGDRPNPMGGHMRPTPRYGMQPFGYRPRYAHPRGPVMGSHMVYRRLMTRRYEGGPMAGPVRPMIFHGNGFVRVGNRHFVEID
ncbi:hypothetical protein HY970_00690 [Candidatus Kaiserbacteria bacterium]|nr:hypothetical protein [Candidatus Kaiserbacteria bacterium]